MSTCRILLQPLSVAQDAKHICSLPLHLSLTCLVPLVCRRVDTQEAHAERAQLRQQLDRAYDVLKFKRAEERNLTQDVAMVSGCKLKTTSVAADHASAF